MGIVNSGAGRVQYIACPYCGLQLSLQKEDPEELFRAIENHELHCMMVPCFSQLTFVHFLSRHPVFGFIKGGLKPWLRCQQT